MSADTSRWPRLKLAPHPQLDWVGVEYTKAKLLVLADAISNNPHPIHTRTADGNLLGVWDPAIETVLRALASKPAALKALNRHRATPGNDVVGLNRAVHFHVQAALHPGRKLTDVQQRVGTIWAVSAGQVKDDVTSFRVGNPSEYRERDAVRLTEQLVALARRNTGGNRKDALALVDADMRDRAAQHLTEK